MQQLMLMLHILIAFLLITLILVQQGKGADIGASFGSGASQTIFGSQGSLPFLVKVTATLAALFFISCLLLGFLTAQSARQAAQANLPSLLRVTTPAPATTPSPLSVPASQPQATPLAPVPMQNNPVPSQSQPAAPMTNQNTSSGSTTPTTTINPATTIKPSGAP